MISEMGIMRVPRLDGVVEVYGPTARCRGIVLAYVLDVDALHEQANSGGGTGIDPARAHAARDRLRGGEAHGPGAGPGSGRAGRTGHRAGDSGGRLGGCVRSAGVPALDPRVRTTRAT